MLAMLFPLPAQRGTVQSGLGQLPLGGVLAGQIAGQAERHPLRVTPPRPGPPAELRAQVPGFLVRLGRVGEKFRPVGHPLDEHPGLGVAQAAGERFVP